MTLTSQLDRCVMCGMCSPHCPTYALTKDENETPRGRIALISAYVKHRLPIEKEGMEHLDHCLECRACEHYCPSGVEFGALMDETRILLEGVRRRPWHRDLLRSWGLKKVTQKRSLKRLFRGLYRYQQSGIQTLLRGSGLLRLLGIAELENKLPPIPATHRWREYYPPKARSQGDVALFTGCVNETLGQDGLDSAIYILNALGYGVFVPAGQVCCGALHKHNGNQEQANQLARKNLAIFATHEVTAILHTATGCTTALMEYGDIPNLSDEQRDSAQRFSAKVSDINQFLLQAEWPNDVHVRPLRRRVAIHTPCSQVHVLRQGDAPRQLLQRIPEVELVMLAENERCCGGAGSYFLTQPSFAAQLRQPKINQLEELGAKTLVTSNIGCALHLRTGLHEQGKTVEICHPVELLARQMSLGDN